MLALRSQSVSDTRAEVRAVTWNIISLTVWAHVLGETKYSQFSFVMVMHETMQWSTAPSSLNTVTLGHFSAFSCYLWLRCTWLSVLKGNIESAKYVCWGLEACFLAVRCHLLKTHCQFSPSFISPRGVQGHTKSYLIT